VTNGKELYENHHGPFFPSSLLFSPAPLCGLLPAVLSLYDRKDVGWGGR